MNTFQNFIKNLQHCEIVSSKTTKNVSKGNGFMTVVVSGGNTKDGYYDTMNLEDATMLPRK